MAEANSRLLFTSQWTAANDESERCQADIPSDELPALGSVARDGKSRDHLPPLDWLGWMETSAAVQRRGEQSILATLPSGRLKKVLEKEQRRSAYTYVPDVMAEGRVERVYVCNQSHGCVKNWKLEAFSLSYFKSFFALWNGADTRDLYKKKWKFLWYIEAPCLKG